MRQVSHFIILFGLIIAKEVGVHEMLEVKDEQRMTIN
jgi:hypothetical protein